MRKLLVGSLCVLSLSYSNLLAGEDTKTKENLADISISGGATYISIEEITGADISTDPILWSKFNAKLHISGFSPSFGYTRSFNGSTSSQSGKKGADKNTAEQIIVNVPFDKIGLTGWSFRYNRYLFNTYLTAGTDREVVLIDHTNTTAKTGEMSYSDAGLTVAYPGESIGLTIQSTRYEIRKELDRRFAGADKSYMGVFFETLRKPWEDTTERWQNTSTGNYVTIVYSEAEFQALGISVGTSRDNKDLLNGFNIKSIGIDISYLDIQLTDNYKFSDKLGENMQAYKVGMKTDVAYKIPTHFLGEKSALIFNAFVNYDYYYVDTNTQSNSDTTVDLSNDFLYGASVALNF